METIKINKMNETLTDITETLTFEDGPSIFTEDTTVDLVEAAIQLMDDFVSLNPDVTSDPDFHEILLEEIQDIFYVQFEGHIARDIYGNIEDDLDDLLTEALQIFVTMFYPDFIRNSNSLIHSQCECEGEGEGEGEGGEKIIEKKSEETIRILEEKIQGLRDIPQPAQRTNEWYLFRSNLITASNAWKAFESQSAINQLIYEKCQPLKISEPDENVKVINVVNTNTAMHHGQKYEPLSVMLYEDLYNTKIEDFGCIQHPTYKFVGASPDGINVDPESDRYGRMLEIKNPVSREITGIPKKEYWVQMQLQMEVCDLDECDFLETKFVEYSDRHTFLSDNATSEKHKGIIIQFYRKDGTPFYAYKPLHLTTDEEILEWEDTTINTYEAEPYQYSYTRYIYWKLEKISCILVMRNREWFNNNITQLGRVWKIIEEERVTGYEHRAPVKRADSSKKYEDREKGQGQGQEPVSLFNFIKKKNAL
jgi:putative phage-type endonuclease